MPLIFWNRLGSSTEAINSVVGSNCSEVNSPVYVAGKFGNGVEVAPYVSPIANMNRVDIPSGIFNCKLITIEFWVKKILALSETFPTFMTSANGANIAGLIDLNIATNDGSIDGPFIYVRNYQDSAQKRFLYTYGNRANLNAAFVLNTWYHIAFTYDDSLSDANKMKYYKDNVQNSMSLYDSSGAWGNNNVNNPALAIGNTKHSGTTGKYWVIDNIKIWDEILTDFSHRLDERHGVNDQKIII